MRPSNSFLHAGAREYVFSLSFADIRPIKLRVRFWARVSGIEDQTAKIIKQLAKELWRSMGYVFSQTTESAVSTVRRPPQGVPFGTAD